MTLKEKTRLLYNQLQTMEDVLNSTITIKEGDNNIQVKPSQLFKEIGLDYKQNENNEKTIEEFSYFMSKYLNIDIPSLSNYSSADMRYELSRDCDIRIVYHGKGVVETKLETY